MNGERLRIVRRLRRWTQKELAESASIAQATISRIESGAIEEPGTNVIEAISAATGFPAKFFVRRSGPELPLGSLTFRARRSATKVEVNEAYAWAEVTLECMCELATHVDLPEVRVAQLPTESPEHAAEITRSAMRHSPDRPIANVTHAMEQAGIWVFAVDVPLEHRDAFSTWPRALDQRPLVVVCTADAPGDRLRWSLAHELGHIVLHHHGPRGTLSEVEKEADRFASEFLMPAATILEEFTRPVTIGSLSELKLRWGVSVASLIYRARELGVISDRRARALFIEISRTWGRSKPEPIHLAVEKPRLLRKVAEIVYGTPPSIPRFADDFDLPPQVVARVLSAHAAREEVIAVVPDAQEADEKIIPFRRPRLSTP